MDCYEEGDAIFTVQRSTPRLERQGPVVIVKSGRHRAQNVTLIENAESI